MLSDTQNNTGCRVNETQVNSMKSGGTHCCLDRHVLVLPCSRRSLSLPIRLPGRVLLSERCLQERMIMREHSKLTEQAGQYACQPPRSTWCARGPQQRPSATQVSCQRAPPPPPLQPGTRRHCCQYNIVYRMLWDSELSLVADREQSRITLTASMADWELNLSNSSASLQLAETLAPCKQLQEAGDSHTTCACLAATPVSQYYR